MKTLIVILGPTASGKTALAIRVAKYFRTEILSADSRQFYRGLDVGTAKPSAEELGLIKHHFINSLSPEEDYNINLYERDALLCLDTIFKSNDVAILAGGSGLYINAVCYGNDELPGSDTEIRKDLHEIMSLKGIEGLQEKLRDLDPEYFELVDKSNTHRLIRAIEICLLTGKKYSALRVGHKKERSFRIIKIGLVLEKEELFARIDRRVDEMMKNGLLEEARKLFPLRNHNALQTVGYQELFQHLEGSGNLEDAISAIKQNTRHYAKRQMTWFRKDPGIHWFTPEEEMKIIPFLEEQLAKLRSV